MKHYYISKMIDPQKISLQARYRRDSRGEESIVHNHEHGRPCGYGCLEYFNQGD